MKTILAALLAMPVLVNASPLCDEVQNDPLGRGYSGMTAIEILADLQTEYRTQQVMQMSGLEVSAHIDATEFAALPDADKQLVTAIAMAPQVNPWGFAANVFIDAFGAPSNTITALANARTEAISRIDELGLGNVKVGHIEGCY